MGLTGAGRIAGEPAATWPSHRSSALWVEMLGCTVQTAVGARWVSLGEAISQISEARGLTSRDWGTKVGQDWDRAKFYRCYRLVTGLTTDPRISSVVAICESLGITVTELFQLAGLLPNVERSTTLVDVELRQMFRVIQELDDADKRLCVALLRTLVDVRRGHRPARRRPRPSRIDGPAASRQTRAAASLPKPS